MKARILSVAVSCGLLAVSGSALAISNNEANANIPFSFSTPGARSLAMGGAFLGAADDATAALANPAGLTRLGLEQQVMLELRHNSPRTPYAAGGSVTNNPFNPTRVRYGEDTSSVEHVSYLAWVLPRDTWALSLYRTTMVDFESNFSTEQIDLLDFPGTFVRPYSSAADLEVVGYGASFAMNLNDNLSFGVGAIWYDFEIASITDRFESDGVTLANRQLQGGDDNDVGFNVGLLYKGSDRFSFGLSYRSAPEFSYGASNTVFRVNDPNTGDLITLDPPVLAANFTTPFKAPDVFGVGMSWRATEQLTFNLDINRVGYSNLSEQVDDAFFTGGDFEVNIDPQILRSLEIEDEIEPRLGVEYVLAEMSYPVSLRAGWWQEKRHTLSFNADPDSLNFDNPVVATANAVLFSTGEDEDHISVGFGWAFPNFQVDLGYDHSDTMEVLSLSGVYRF
ncbi:OmpP1/FadL family transporter [Pseudomarimonas arenosa]|uniref:Outer membrane protein transport protein n=1 Tax=Pseudomarimonas arenosa TaxID=2774145 RepID=A0AAW3ZJG7_9GAMM|nr:outer membrane protein transport protein [Pseudomarimonas arenosa]MBD8526141.1 outer membrane protein transport protein [Pseudomarimonas arenosa]